MVFLSFLICLLVPSMSHAKYTYSYDLELDLLSITNPQLAIEQSKPQLLEAIKNNNIKRQLVLLFYLAESYSTLSNITEVDNFVKQGLALAKQQKNTRFIIEFTTFEIYQFVYNGNLDESLLNVNKSLQMSKEVDDVHLKATQLTLRAQVYLSKESYNLALKDTEAALEVFKLNNDREELRNTYNLMALIYDSMGDYESAIKYYEESMANDDSNSTYIQATMFYNMGATYSYMGEHELAIENYNKSMLVSQKNNDSANIAYINYGLAELYLIQNDYLVAAEKAESGRKWFAENSDLLMHFNCNILLSDIKIRNGLFLDALNYLNLAEQQLELLNTPRSYLSYYKHKINFYTAQKMWENAFEIQSKDKLIREKLYLQEKEDSNNDLKVKFNAQFDKEKMSNLTKLNELQKAAIYQEKGKHQYFIWLIVLISFTLLFTYVSFRNQRSIKRKFYQLTIKDDLTQISNRRYILEQLNQLHLNTLKTRKPYVLVMIDLDHFKKINDEFGHSKGNQVLVHFANVVSKVLPNECCVGRLGGEEWLLLLPGFDSDKTKNLLKLIRKKYNNPDLLNLDAKYNLHFSSGVVICDGQIKNLEDILKLVDKVMYSAKNNGRNNDIYYQTS